jgi:hypothetical protein
VIYRFAADVPSFKTVETPSYLVHSTNVFLATIDLLRVEEVVTVHDIGTEVSTIMMHSASVFGRITITDQCWDFPFVIIDNVRPHPRDRQERLAN